MEKNLDKGHFITGYYDNLEATSDIIETDVNGTRWIRTGDIGYVDEDGFVFVKGRIKRMYVTAVSKNGEKAFYKIIPTHIEDTLNENKDVTVCATIVREDSDRINIPIVFVTLREGVADKDGVIDNLKNLAARELPEHMQPDDITVLDTMPLTPSGKIDYRALEQMQ